MDIILPGLAQRLKPLRMASGKTQKEMAKLLDVTESHYQKIEYGYVNISATTLMELADYFRVTTDYLLGIDLPRTRAETVDQETWPRREIYEFFAPMSHPFYSLTFPVDITKLREHCCKNGLPFYPAMVYAVIKAMEQVEAFLYRDRKGTIVKHAALVPSFTDLKPGSDLFHIVTLEANCTMDVFCRRAKEQSAAQRDFITSGPWESDQEVYFTCLPWFPITGLTNERDNDPSDTIPRVSWGRWEEQEGRTMLSLSLELNHRLLDGVHVGQFYQALSRLIDGL